MGGFYFLTYQYDHEVDAKTLSGNLIGSSSGCLVSFIIGVMTFGLK